MAAVAGRRGLKAYRSLALWMVLPMVIMQAGILRDYWGDFSDNAWAVHVHYWTATLWYLFLITQPWLATHGQIDRHRTWGMIGFFLAGGVALTALAALARDIVNAENSALHPDQFAAFGPWFFYGIAAVELVMMSAFTVAIIQAIRLRRSLEDHAWWLVSTVFIIMMPSLGRGLQFLWIMRLGPNDPVVVLTPLYVATGMIIALLFWAAHRYGRWNHPATLLALGVNLFNLLVEPLGRWPWLQGVLTMLLKP